MIVHQAGPGVAEYINTFISLDLNSDTNNEGHREDSESVEIEGLNLNYAVDSIRSVQIYDAPSVTQHTHPGFSNTLSAPSMTIQSSISQIENSRKQLSNENPLLNLLRLNTENTSQVRRRFPEYKISKEEKDLYFSQDFEPIVDWGSLPIIVGSIFIFHRGLLKTWREKKTRSAIYVMLFGDVFCWCFIFSSLY
eukprot:UN23270